jgi:hypothetical protein
MFTFFIQDCNGRDISEPNAWLSMGRVSRQSLNGEHRLSVASGNHKLASAVVKRVVGSPNSVWIGEFEAVNNCPEDVLAALIYHTLREARVVGCSLALIEGGDCAARVEKILLKTTDFGHSNRIVQRVDYGMFRAFAQSGSELQSALAEGFPSEIERTVEHHLMEFFTNGAWATTVRGGQLSRRQYVATLINLHSYVRFTTRLLGHCVGISEDRLLRAHYIEHLKGEINHECIIERDLTNLGEDVEYVTCSHQPTVSILHFMSIQESIIGFQRDPILFLACPIAAESFAAYVQADIVDGLVRSISDWGLSDPRDVTHFIRSHSGFDGGADGHWGMCIKVLANYVRAHERMQRFSFVVHSGMLALRKQFDSCIVDFTDPI